VVNSCPGCDPPGARYSHAAIYDSVRDRMVVFGGTTGNGAPQRRVGTQLGRRPNSPPDCSHAVAVPSEIRAQDYRLVPVHITGVTDPDGDPVTIMS